MKLIKLRYQRNLTQKEMSEKLGISEATYAKIERGGYDPRLNVAQKTAKFFSKEIKDIEELCTR